MNKWYVGFVVIVLVIITHFSVHFCTLNEGTCSSLAPVKELSVWDNLPLNVWGNEPVLPVQGRVTAALHSFAQKYLLCAKCFFAPQSDALFWLINFSQMAYSAVMLAWHEVQAQIHTWTMH